MAQQSSRRIVVFCASAIALAVVCSLSPLAAQTRSQAALDLRRRTTPGGRFGGTRLSRRRPVARVRADVARRGRRARRPQPEDRIRNLKSPRGTNPQFTPDGKFVIFTIVPPKAEDERRESRPGRGRRRRRRLRRGRGGWRRRRRPRNALGIMTLPGGQVTTIEHVATFRLPEESSTWLAYHKGRARRRRRGGGGRGGGRRRVAAADAAGGGNAARRRPPAAQAGRPQGSSAGGATAAGEAQGRRAPI